MMTIFSITGQSRILSVLRIATALFFMQHGGQKLFGFPGPAHGEFTFFSMMGIGGIIEFFGAIFLFAGLFTRSVAFLLSGQMAVAYFMFHAPKGFYPALNGGELAALYCFVFLYLCFAGGGEWGLDRFLGARNRN